MSRSACIRAVAVTAGFIVLAATARADAPIDQYGLFNSTAETIVDLSTGLIWQRSAPPQLTDFDAAVSYCAGLSLATPSGPSIGWRVPSYKELLTLVDETPHTEYVGGTLVDVWIDANAFPATAVDAEYWTSSPYLPQNSYAYVVSFGSGRGEAASMTPPGGLHVRCVLDPPASAG
jgi:hypothetical protein